VGIVLHCPHYISMNPHIGDIDKHFNRFINVHKMSEEPEKLRTEHMCEEITAQRKITKESFGELLHFDMQFMYV